MTSSEEPERDETRSRHGGEFYDQPEVFARYQQHRAWHLNPNATLEEHAFLEELGSVAQARVLDLGCGDASTGVTLLAAGCGTYLGIDGSHLMVQAAGETLEGTVGHAVFGDLENYESQPEAFDLIVSRMVLHYLEDISTLLRRCYESLAPDGRIVFTVTHPVITSHDRRASTTQRRQDWLVDNYFLEGPRSQIWLGAESVWQHRTIETYVRELRTAGFDLANLRECEPQPDRFDDASEFERRQRIPLMLLLAGARR
jgi:SAM-dependent methyltransferase